MKTVKRYEVRTVRKGNKFSSATNFRLYERHRALKLVKRLKKSGIDAIATPVTIAT